MFLSLKNVTIGYNSPLISNINTKLALGDICLLMGDNGVGKTTLIKSILRQVPILKGYICIDNKNIKSLSVQDISKLVSVVFSKSYIPDNYTVYDLISLGKYIYYPYYFKLDTKDLIEINNIIDDLGLKDYKNLSLKKLSDGNLQKAFIGRALAQNSPFIILDEPTTHLDEKNKVIILRLLKHLAKKYSKLILFSSHDWRISKKISDKIWYIKDGFLYSGISEDIILEHRELHNDSIHFNNIEFTPPKVIAPDRERDLLFSFLQKKYCKDLSHICFEYTEGKWLINNKYIVNNFKSIEIKLKSLI